MFCLPGISHFDEVVRNSVKEWQLKQELVFRSDAIFDRYGGDGVFEIRQRKYWTKHQTVSGNSSHSMTVMSSDDSYDDSDFRLKMK